MAIQYQWTRVSGTAAGTITIARRDGVLGSIIIPANATGTATFYDTNSGTSATTHMFTLPNTVGSIPTSLNLNARFKNGLVAVTGGTTDFTVMWS